MAPPNRIVSDIINNIINLANFVLIISHPSHRTQFQRIIFKVYLFSPDSIHIILLLIKAKFYPLGIIG
jgi:hypothetical protein